MTVHSTLIDRPATYADIEALPPHVTGQIVYGVLHAHPRPAPRHVRVASALGGELFGPYDRGRGGPGDWIILDEPELHLNDHVIVPDLAGWRRERMPALPETAWFGTAPDWVCEVLSPSTARLDRHEKRRAYAEAGVAHLWLIDPVGRVLEAFTLAEGTWRLDGTRGEGDACDLPPFAAVPFPMDALWTL